MGYEYNLGILFGHSPLESVYLGRDLEYNYVIQGDRSPFYGITTLRDLVVGEHVTTVDDYCFHGCTGLASVSIGGHVATIGEYAFYGCTGLTSVSLPASVTTVSNYAFRGSGLTSVRFEDSDSLLTLGTSVFDDLRLCVPRLHGPDVRQPARGARHDRQQCFHERGAHFPHHAREPAEHR